MPTQRFSIRLAQQGDMVLRETRLGMESRKCDVVIGSSNWHSLSHTWWQGVAEEAVLHMKMTGLPRTRSIYQQPGVLSTCPGATNYYLLPVNHLHVALDKTMR